MNKISKKLMATCLLFLFAGIMQLSANNENSATWQGITVSGTVTENGTPMPGVNVIVKGTSTGFVTDFNGRYTITVPNSSAVLQFSFIGYVTQEFTVGNQTIINVTMSEDAAQIEEVVVVGYGTMRKSDLTGSLSQVSSEKLNAYPAQGVTQALQGRAPGLQIITTNADPGGGTRIRIRGGTSLNSSNDPLYVVDGFPGGMVPAPENIESIEILKDASATAIYGSRASNGVVLITTKSGKAGRAKVEWNSSYSIDNVARKIDVLNAWEFAEFMNELASRDGRDAPFSNPSSLGKGTDWFDLVTRTGYIQNHQLAASGGTDKLRFYNSVNLFDQDGIIIRSNYKRISGLSRINYDIGNRLKVGTNLFFQRNKSNSVRTQEGSGGTGGTGVIAGALNFEPTKPIYNENGTYSIASFGDPRDNPYAMAKEYLSENTNDRFQGQIRAELMIIEGLTFTSTFGTTIHNSKSGSYWPTTLNEGRSNNGEANIQGYKRTSMANENYFTYNKTIGIHRLNAMAGFSQNTYRNESYSFTNRDFSRDQYRWWNMGAGANRQSNSSGLSEWATASFYGRLMYNLDNRYLLTVTGRYDGDSRMGADSKWGFFPSAAVAWNIKNEQFMQSIDALSQLKLRLSYGITGNASIGEYMSFANMGATLATMNDGQVPAMRPDIERVANAKLSWESAIQTNIGLDIGFFKGRLNITADYFIKETKDLLYRQTLVQYSGYNRAWLNIGSMEYNGFEISVSSVNFKKEFNWTTDFQLSFYRNKVTNLPEGDVWSSNWPGHLIGGTSTYVLREGSPAGSFAGYRYHGVDRETGAPLYYRKDSDGNWMDTPVPVSQMSQSRDRDIIGNPDPKFEYGFNNTFSYKNFDLNIFFQGVVGNDMFNFSRAELEWCNGKVNQMKTVLNRWTDSNKDTDIPVASTSYGMISSSRWLEKGTYLRLRNVALGYNIKIPALQGLGVERFRVYVSGQNLFIITDYKGFDPDISYGQGNIVKGFDYGSYPSTRSFTFGLNLIF